MNGDYPDAVRVSFESRAVCYIECYRRQPGEEDLGPARASGFFWAQEDQLYLVTNWHNVTGLNPSDLRENGRFAPTHLRVWFNENQEVGQAGSRLVKFVPREVALYDVAGHPTWIEHPEGRKVDVVAIPVEKSAWRGRIHPVNEKNSISYKPMAGEDCFIVGYPEGLLGPIGTPIWKRASIATEPELDYADQPVFLADSLTRRGLSGAPVFVRVNGLWGQEGEQLIIGGENSPVLGFWTNFLGIYAGREGDEKTGFQLARVWKKSALEELLTNGVRGQNPHEG